MIFPAGNLQRVSRAEVRSAAEAALPPPPADDDTTRLQALLEGDEAAFDALVARHQSGMLRLARSYVGSADIAEEVVQETWLGVIRGLRSFRGQSSLRTWIFRILINRARTRARREARTVPFSALPGSDGTSAHEPADRLAVGHMAQRPEFEPLHNVLSAELGQLLEAAVSALPERQRTVLTLRDIEGWSAPEVRNVLRISETNQRVLLHRARSRVRKELEPYIQEGRSVGEENSA